MSFFGDRQFTLDRVVRLALGLLLVIGVFWALAYFSDVLLPFALAVILAYLLAPLVRWVERWVRRRILSVAITLTAVLGVLALTVIAAIPVVATELRETGLLLQQLLTDLDLDRRAGTYLPPALWERLRALIEQSNLAEVLVTNNFWDLLDALLDTTVPNLPVLFSNVLSMVLALTGFLLVLLYLVFLLIDFERLQEGYPRLIPPNYRLRILGMVRDFESAMSRYFRAQLLIVLIEMVLFGVGFWWIGLPLGFLFGLFLGLLGVVPYLHVLGLGPGFLLVTLHALRGGDFEQMLLLSLGVFGLVLLLQELVLVPRFQGKATGLNPAMIFLSLSLWGKILGFLGLVIALPMTYLILAYYRQFIARQEERETEEDELEEEEEQLSYS